MAIQTGTVIPYVSHTTATAIGNGNSHDLGQVYKQPVAQIATNGAVAAGVVVLQGSLDGLTWYTVATSAALTAADIVLTATIPARFLRTSITTTVTGGTITTIVGAAA